MTRRAEGIGKDDTKLGQYFSKVASLTIPSAGEKLRQAGSTYGVTDVVVHPGQGLKDAAGGDAELQGPMLLRLS